MVLLHYQSPIYPDGKNLSCAKFQSIKKLLRHLTEITTQTANFMVRLKENGFGFLPQVVINTSVMQMVLRKSTVFIDISFNSFKDKGVVAVKTASKTSKTASNGREHFTASLLMDTAVIICHKASRFYHVHLLMFTQAIVITAIQVELFLIIQQVHDFWCFRYISDVQTSLK